MSDALTQYVATAKLGNGSPGDVPYAITKAREDEQRLVCDGDVPFTEAQRNALTLGYLRDVCEVN